jgi:rhamnogalacturonan endolyase
MARRLNQLMFWLVAVVALADLAPAQRQMEALTRGVTAVPTEQGHHLVSWRLFGTDPDDIAFNIYRRGTAGHSERINDAPVSGATNFLVPPDITAADNMYVIQSLVKGVEGQSSAAASVWTEGYLEIPIQPIDEYRPGDASVADLDGDGEYEIVIQQVGRTHDNSHSGLTDKPILDAYEFDGTHLWRIDLGHNIRAGEHYTQFMVYDLDGDGRAEVACKTADGSIDGAGKVIGDATADWRTTDAEARTYGRILEGPEFLTIFDGLTGAELKTVDYVPSREPIDGWGGIGGNGGNDNYGNRCDRFLACIAYLDGRRPSLVMCRGVYGRTVLVAWDWRDGNLSQRWMFDSGTSNPPYRDASPYSGMGGHSLSVADVDQDGRDEIVYHAMVVDDDGKGLYSTGLRHGDAMHVSDMIPDRPGLEIFTVQENEGATRRFETPGAALRDARTGEILWSHSPGIDVGAGLAADIDPRHPGYEVWGGPGGLRNCQGETIARAPRTTSFAIWWDGDPLRELLTSARITRWDWEQEREVQVKQLAPRNRRVGRYPCLMGDIVGDWREEVLVPAPDGRSLRLYTTNIPTELRLPTLMHDPQYRLSIAWQNVAYNKPPHPGFFLGHNMPRPRRQDIDLISPN